MLSTERFSSRVRDYVRFRPSYPPGVIALLRRRCGLEPGSRVADVGSGTGILTTLLLDAGATVFAIEPNQAMRDAAAQQLGQSARFRSIDGTAEATTLPTGSMDLVTAAQAFHWFDVTRARAELARVLRPEGSAALIWNERPTHSSPFLTAYEALVRRHSSEYEQVTSKRANAATIGAFFGGPYEIASFPNEQQLDFEGLTGRLMSSSYAPEAGHPEHEPMLSGLRAIFDAYASDGTVTFPYQTLVHFGRVAQSPV